MLMTVSTQSRWSKVHGLWIISNFSPLYLLCLEYSRQLINVAEREKKGRIEGGKRQRRKKRRKKKRKA